MNKFYIRRMIWNKIIDYARIAYDEFKSEIGGMAIIYRKKDSDNWSIERPVILKQEISGSNTSIDKEHLARYYTKEATYMQENYPELEYRFLWWHSHHKMAAFWSGTDHKAIEEFSVGDVSFALVVNLDQDYKFRVSLWNPITVAQDVDLNIIDEKNKDLSKEMIKEVKDLCEEESTHTHMNNAYLRGLKRKGGIPVAGDRLYLWQDDTHEEEVLHMASYDPVLTEVIEELTQISEKFVEGSIGYRELSKTMRRMKKSSEDDNLAWKIDVPSKNNAFDRCMYGNGIIDSVRIGEIIK